MHLALIAVYSALQVGIGLWLGRSVRTSADFFVARRRLGPALLFASLIAANIGAGSTVGAAGLGYRDGLSAWWWVGSAGLGSVVLAFVIGPRMRDLAARHDLHTIGDYLEFRYSPAVRAVASLVIGLITLMILAGQLVAAAFILHAVAGIPKMAGCVIAGGVMTTYFAAGGLGGTAWVNAAQLVFELTIFIVLVPVAVGGGGGWDEVAGRIAAPPEYWNPWRGGGSGWMYLLFLAPSFMISPGLLQKVYGARDAGAVRVGVGLNAAALLVFALLPVVLGMVARSLHPGLPHRELALPTLLRDDLPTLVGALGMAAIFSTEINTADAILFMLSTSLSRDLYARFLRPRATDADVLRAARWAAVAGGLLGVLLALAAESVIVALTAFYTLLTACLFVPVLIGLYAPRAGAPEALAAMAGGIIGVALGSADAVGLDAPLAGLVGSAAACGVVMAARRRRNTPRTPPRSRTSPGGSPRTGAPAA